MGGTILLPFDTTLASGLCGRSHGGGRERVDADAAEEPGKILHEVRRASSSTSGLETPPTHYGTVDATPLWVVLLHDAWRWGLPTTTSAPCCLT